MPKAEAGTPKAIGKAIKAKGLQKLMFFCQICQKQCRDANGFKCHMASENHQRQMLIVAENPERFTSEYSGQFLKDFMHLFKTRFGSKRVFANQVYQEYIKDRYHIHMNSTRWLSLSGFVQWLGRNSYAEVDQTERGWYITYIDRDPETLARQENAKKKEKMEKDYDERMRIITNKQIERGKQSTNRTINDEKTEEDKLLIRDDESNKIVLKLDLNKNSKDDDSSADKNVKETSKIDKSKDVLKLEKDASINDLFDQDDDKPISLTKQRNETRISAKSQKEVKRSALDEIIEEEERKKKKIKRDHWIEKDLIVKVISKKLPEKYQNKKGFIERVEDKYTAFVRMNESNALIKLDQDDLETVIPKEGNLVKIVNGGYQGQIAKLIKVDQVKIIAIVRIEKGLNTGREIEVDLDHICKFLQIN